MLTCITNHRLTVKQNQMKLFQTSINTIKLTLYFPGFVLCHVLVACCLMMVRCTVEFMNRGCHKYISKLSLESELDLIKYCNIDILISIIYTSILMQNKLKYTLYCYVCLMLQKQENWQKFLANWILTCQIRHSFNPYKVLLYDVYYFRMAIVRLFAGLRN